MGGIFFELAAYIIAELIHVQCDDDRNKYLLLEAFIIHRKDGSALSVEDQKIVVNGQETLWKSTAGLNICCKLHIMGEVIQS